MSKKNEGSWQALMPRHIFALGYAHAGDQEASGMCTIEGSIWYRERIVLPPSAEIHGDELALYSGDERLVLGFEAVALH